MTSIRKTGSFARQRQTRAVLSSGIASMVLASIAGGLSSCSFQRRQTGPTTLIELELPGVDAGSRSAERSAFSTTRYPAMIGDFSCLLVRVSGEGITPMASVPAEPSACAEGASTRIAQLASGSDIGIISDPVPLSGGRIALDVPIGSRRTFQLLGVVTSTGNCPASFSALADGMGGAVVDRILEGLIGVDEALEVEAPVVLASSTVDVVGDASVTLSPSYSTSTSTPIFCDGIGAPEVMDVSVESVVPVSAETGAPLDAVFRLRFNKAVTGLTAADIVPQSAGVEVLSVVESGLREFQTTIRVTPGSVPATLRASGDFLGLALAKGAVTDLFGMTNIALSEDFSPVFVAAAGGLWEAADPDAPTDLQLVSPASSPGNLSNPTIRVSGVSSGQTVMLFTSADCSAASEVASGTASGSFVDLTASALTAEGVHLFYAQVENVLGSRSSCSTLKATYEYDITPPTIGGLTSSTTPVKSKTWSWSCDDEPCTYQYLVDQTPYGAPSMTYSTETSVSRTAGDGTFYLHLRAKDSAGNVSAVEHYSALLDNTAPSAPVALSLESPGSSPSGDTTPTISVTGVVASDSVSLHADVDCAGAAVATGTANDSMISLTTSELTVGVTYGFYAKSTDPAGNASGCSTTPILYQVLAGPATPSSLTLSTPGSSPDDVASPMIAVGGVGSGFRVELYTSPGCEAVSFKGHATATGSTAYVTSAALTEGTHVFYARAVDTTTAVASGCSSASVSYEYDDTSPVILGLAHDSEPTRSKSWSWSCNDEPCTYRFEVSTAAAPSEAFYASGFGSETGTSQTSGSGTFYLHVQAQDAAGNPSDSITTVSALIDNTAPSITSLNWADSLTSAAIEPTVGAFWDRLKVDVINSSDNQTAFESLLFNLDASGLGSCSTSPAGTANWEASPETGFELVLGDEFDPESASSVSRPIVIWVKDEAGNMGCTETSFKRLALAVEPFFDGYSGWSDYVTSGSMIYPSAATACSPSSASARSDCVRAGAYRRVNLTSLGITSCAGLSYSDGNIVVSDELSAFSWSCEYLSGPNVHVARGIYDSDTRLPDLIDFYTNSWKSNPVTITRSDGAEAITYNPGSGSSAWWNNTFGELAGSAATAVSTSGRLLLVESSGSTEGIQLAASKTGVVLKPGVQLTLTGSAPALISAPTTGTHSLWIEGPGTDDEDSGSGNPVTHLTAATSSSPRGVALNGTYFATVKGLRADGGTAATKTGGTGFDLNGTAVVSLDDLEARYFLNHGFYFAGTNSYTRATRLTGLSSGSTSGSGIKVFGALQNFEFETIRLEGNASHGLLVTGSSASLLSRAGSFSEVVSVNNGGSGISIENSQGIAPIKLWNVKTINNDQHGIYLGATSTVGLAASGVIVVNAYSAFNGTTSAHSGIHVIGSSSTSNLLGNIRLVGITSVNNAGTGLYLYESTNSVVHNALLMGNKQFGIRAFTLTSPVFSQIAATKNSNSDYMDAGSSSVGGKFLGTSLFDGSKSSTCPTGTGLGVQQAGSFSCISTSGGGTLVGVAPTSSPFNAVSSDSINDSNPSQYASFGYPSDWFHFETETRTFGLFGVTLGFPLATSTAMSCNPMTQPGAAGACTLHDLALDGSSDWILNASYAGSTATGSSTQSCAGLSGSLDNSVTDGSSTWHRNAIEVMGDSTAPSSTSDNGLCEAGETCIHAPNYGAYQGHGDSDDSDGDFVSCSTLGSGLSGVSLQAFEENGR